MMQSVHELVDGSVTTLVLLTVTLTIFLYVIYSFMSVYANKFQVLKRLKDFPGPPAANWLAGNIYETNFDGNHLRLQSKWTTAYKGAFSYSIGPYVFLELNNPSTLAKILNTAEPKDPRSYEVVEPWIGDGLLVSTGAKWFRSRRLLTPAFHFDILKPYIALFSSSANILAEKWKTLLRSQKSLDMFEHISLMTLDSLLKCIFGIQDCRVQLEGKKNEYIRCVYALTDVSHMRFRYLPFLSDLIFNLSPSGFEFHKCCKIVHDYSQRIIYQRREEKKREKELGIKSNRKYMDFLDILIDAEDSDGKGLTDLEIRNEVDTFMFEGHDTTASGLSWCLYNLARHPEYQQKCRDEINEVMGERSEVIWDDMTHLQYLIMCIKESLRLHPAVPNVARLTTKPLPLPDGRVIPSNVSIGVAIYACHHHPGHWENPEVYDPERFTPENSKDRSPHAFIPFSAGPRNCIGQHFAMHEMRSVLALLLKNFKFQVDEDRIPELSPDLVLRAKGGLWLKVLPIEE